MIGLYAAAALLLGLGAYLLTQCVAMPRNERIARQLAAVGREASPLALDAVVHESGSRFPVPLAAVRRKFLLADLRIGVPPLLFAAIASTALFAAAAILVNVETAGFAIAALFSLVAFYVNGRANRNRRRFLELLPSFIERLHQLLAAGNSLVTAFDKALELSEPLACAYLRPVAVRLAHGATLSDSLNVQGHRLGIAQLTMLSVIARANQRFGGSLGEILAHVVSNLNNRLQVQQEFDAMTAEIRTSAKILVALPIVVTVAVFVLNPAYIAFFGNDPLGHSLLAFALGTSAIGIFVLRLLIRIEY